MNSNVWNIKEILNIPTGSSGSKTSRNMATSGYSSLTDSQFAYGSQTQFCLEDSQIMSQEMSFSSKNSQQSSQELLGSETKLSSNYHTKPFLFGGDGKDKFLMQRGMSILEKFEEDKKKAKEKCESEILAKECQHYRETLNNMQEAIIRTEENTVACKTVLEGFDSFVATVQQSFSSLQNGITQQFETVRHEVNSCKSKITEMEERVQKTDVATTELGSHMHGLQQDVESLKQEHQREQTMLEEAINLLTTLVSKQSNKLSPGGVTDCAIQTSPGLAQPTSKIQPEEEEPICQQLKSSLHEVSSEDPRGHNITNLNSKSTVRSHRSRRRRPPLLSQRRKCTIWDENHQLPTKSIKQEVVSPLKERHDQNMLASLKPEALLQRKRESTSSKCVGGFISPASFWSQDSSSSMYITGIEPVSEDLPTVPKWEIPANAKGFWQLFDMTDCDSDSSIFPIAEK